MPVPSKTRYPLMSFDPRLRDIWLTAIRQPVEIPCDSVKQAVAFQNRLQQYRAALKREHPEDAAILYRAKASRRGNVVVVQKQDLEFENVLEQIDSQLIVHSEPGVPTPVQPAGPSSTPLPHDPPSATPVSIDELFADIPITTAYEGDSYDD